MTELVRDEKTEFTHGHALLVGVGGDLPTTVKDAEDLHDMLVDSELCAYPENQVEILTEEGARRHDVLEALDRLALRVQDDPEATVVVYFSGHGMGGKTPRLLTYGHDVDNVERLPQTTVSSEEFTEKLRAIESKKLLVLLDCCHASGHADPQKRPMPKAPIPIAALKEFTRGSGRVVLASSRADEYSYTHDDNSYFTEALLEALSGHGASEFDGYTRVLDIAMYAGRVVPNRKRDKQHPVLKVWNLSDNFTLSYYAGGDEDRKGLRPIRKSEVEGLQGSAPSRVGYLLERLKDTEADLEETQKQIDEYRSSAPRALVRKRQRLENEVLELKGKLETLPEQTDYNRTVTTLWTILGVLIFYTSYNLFALTQDWPLLFWSAFRDLGDATVSLFGLYWGLPTLAILIRLTHFYQDLDERKDFYTRLPVAFNLPLYSDTSMRRKYQIFFLVLFFVVPMYAQGHFLRKMPEGYVYDRKAEGGTKPVVTKRLEHFWLPLPDAFGDRYRLERECGVTFFPFWGPWLLLVLEVALFFSFFRLLYRLLRPRDPTAEAQEGPGP